jgi:hypothetical protein
VRHTLLLPLAFTGALTTGVMLYADFQAQRLASAELPPQPAQLPPQSVSMPKVAGRSGETTDSSPREIHCPDGTDCLLDPLAADCRGNEHASKPPVDPGPGKLGPDAIMGGVDGIRTKLEKCGAGAKVAIKFVVDGSTGAVKSATPLDEHASTPLGKCVARVAQNARFPKFEAPQQGFTFKFRL